MRPTWVSYITLQSLTICSWDPLGPLLARTAPGGILQAGILSDGWTKGETEPFWEPRAPFLHWLSLSWGSWAASSTGYFPLGHKLLSPGNPSSPLAVSLQPVQFTQSSFTTCLARGWENSASTPRVQHQSPDSWLVPSWSSQSREGGQERIPGGLGTHPKCINWPSLESEMSTLMGPYRHRPWLRGQVGWWGEGLRGRQWVNGMLDWRSACPSPQVWPWASLVLLLGLSLFIMVWSIVSSES